MRNHIIIPLLTFTAVLFIQGCSSSTNIYVRPSYLGKKQPHVDIKVKTNNNSDSGDLIRITQDPSKQISQWDKLEGGDSGKKSTAKLMYSLTPWGFATNAIHGKRLIGTTTVYQLPPGETKILIYNFHLLETETKPTDGKIIHYHEYGSWGTVITANLQNGQKYTLSPRTFSAPQSNAGKVSAFVDLLDKNGNNVATRYEFLTPLETVEMKALSRETNDAFIAGLPTSTQGAATAGEMAPLVQITVAELNRFLTDVEEGKYDQ